MKSETEVLIDALDQGYNYFRNILKKGLEANNRYREEKEFNDGFFKYLSDHQDDVRFKWSRVDKPHFKDANGKQFVCKKEIMFEKRILQSEDSILDDSAVYDLAIHRLNERTDVHYFIYSLTGWSINIYDVNNLDNPEVKTEYFIKYAIKEIEEDLEEIYDSGTRNCTPETYKITDWFITCLDKHKDRVNFKWKKVHEPAGFDKEYDKLYCVRSRIVYSGDRNVTNDVLFNAILKELNDENPECFFLYELVELKFLIPPDYTKVDDSKVKFVLRYAKEYRKKERE